MFEREDSSPTAPDSNFRPEPMVQREPLKDEAEAIWTEIAEALQRWKNT